jgi:hypothetical protein
MTMVRRMSDSSGTGAGNMQTNLKNRVRNLRFLRVPRLTPLFEAVSNSLHAIAATRRKDGEIRIVIERKAQKEMQGPVGEAVQPIESIVITDNGEGFGDRNFEAFKELDTGIKEQLGSKGIGRLFWLKVFDRAVVDSVFRDGDKLLRRKFVFRLPDGIAGEIVEICDPSTPAQTTVRLVGLRDHFSRSYRIGVSEVREAVLHHLLSFFVTQFVPRIEFVEEGNVHATITADSLPKIDESPFDIRGISFRLIHMKLSKDSVNSHAVHFCAADRVVKSRTLGDLLGNFTKRQIEERKEYYYYGGYVLSPKLNESVAAERDDFQIEEHVEDLFGDKSVAWQEIEEEVAHRVESWLKTPLAALRRARDERVESVFTHKVPELTYLRRLGIEELDNFPLDASESEIALRVNKLHFEKRRTIIERLDATLESLEADDIGQFEEFRAKFAAEILSLSEVGQADLSAYMLYRQRVLSILLKAVQFKDGESRFEKEKVVHSLFFPRFQDSEGASIYDGHNLWLIDEALAFENYIASDLKLGEHKLLLSDSEARPDIAAYGLHFGINRPSHAFDHITIVEFKRPGKKLGRRDNPIQQIYDYIDDIRAGKVRDFHGLELKANQQTRFLGIVLCDSINEQMVTAARRENLLQEADGVSWHGNNTNYNLYLRVVPFRQIYELACRRHQKFFEQLGLTPKI